MDDEPCAHEERGLNPRRERVTIRCSVCGGTGMRPIENGPAGATWTDYERCSSCKGVGAFYRW